jgi:DNA-directed RNA polymerase specialized sigma24 family protein
VVTEAALEELYRTRYTRFLRLGYALLGNVDLARDAVQETFATALRRERPFAARARSRAGCGRRCSTSAASSNGAAGA